MKTARALIAAIALAAPVALAAAPAAAAVPTNDLPSGAIVVSDGFSETRDTTEATTDAYDAQANETCHQPTTDASVWYSFTAVTDAAVRVDPALSSFSVGILVATGEPGNLSTVDCTAGAVIFEATAGTTYSILAFDNQGDGGGNGGTLNIAVTAPVRPTAALTIDPVGRVDAKTGVATVTGTFTCTNAPAMHIFGALWQGGPVEDDRTVYGGIDLLALDGPCDGTQQVWTVDVTAFNGRFRGGKANAILFPFVCSPVECIDAQTAEAAVQLRGGGR